MEIETIVGVDPDAGYYIGFGVPDLNLSGIVYTRYPDEFWVSAGKADWNGEPAAFAAALRALADKVDSLDPRVLD